MASIATANHTGLYLDGITVAGRLTRPMGGVDGASVETIVEGGLVAVVSSMDVRRICLQRANLATHQAAVAEVGSSV